MLKRLNFIGGAFVVISQMAKEQPSPVYVFDLDGVITDPANSRVNEGVLWAMHRLIYDWAKSFADTVERPFVSIGDSVSDYEMARYFAEQGARSTFVYVDRPTDKFMHDEHVIFAPTEAHYDAGTLEFLSK